MWAIAKPKASRRNYCGGKSSTFNDKYIPVRKTEGHYECRVFNSTLNPIAIAHMWRQLDKEIRKIA